MFGFFSKVLFFGIVGYAGYVAYDLHRAGYFELPDIPDGSYPISFSSGFRAIVHGVDATDDVMYDAPKWFRRLNSAIPERKFLGIPANVAPWFASSWSNCYPPTAEERDGYYASLPEETQKNLEHARLDGVCVIEVDGDKMLRGLVFSVPRV